MEYWELKQMQSLPLEIKIQKTKLRIQEFYEHYEGNVYVSFSGGKDSTVLLDIARSVYPNIKALFVDTGLEYPEIKEFVKSIKNVTWIKPEESFGIVIKKYGYPVVSKKVARMIRDIQNPTDKNETSRKLYLTGIKSDGSKTKSFKLAKKWIKLIDAPFKTSEVCCNKIKKEPIYKYEKETGEHGFVGTMASDSMQRMSAYIKTGCNSFSNGKSTPLGFWNEEDIWEYLKKNNVPYSKIYDMGVSRTGCMFCMFGVHLESSPNRFEQMQSTHPKQYDYCINKLGCGKVMDFIGVNYKDYKQESTECEGQISMLEDYTCT